MEQELLIVPSSNEIDERLRSRVEKIYSRGSNLAEFFKELRSREAKINPSDSEQMPVAKGFLSSRK